ncbi:glycosyltransferase [Pseudarthrobacter sulfonivorans]|uniref:glycosyltransferase n=1 Tax=Pseudarthrobacter sulfonivorans TaxID=121292 RepID=UPI00389B32E0
MPLRIAAKMHNRDEHEYFRTVIKPLLGPDAEYLGKMNTADKYALLGGAAALLNPIQWPEPFGMVMIESLAAGTPVIATPRGSAWKSSTTAQPGSCAAESANSRQPSTRRDPGPQRMPAWPQLASAPNEWSPNTFGSTRKPSPAFRPRPTPAHRWTQAPSSEQEGPPLMQGGEAAPCRAFGEGVRHQPG